MNRQPAMTRRPSYPTDLLIVCAQRATDPGASCVTFPLPCRKSEVRPLVARDRRSGAEGDGQNCRRIGVDLASDVAGSLREPIVSGGDFGSSAFAGDGEAA